MNAITPSRALNLFARSAEVEGLPVDLEAEFGRARHELFKERAQTTCRHKLVFRSAAAARNAEILRLSRSRREFHGVKGRPYHCPVCGYWHLTTKQQEDRR
jgi:rubrerythrin